jgi:hypothetical protein
MIRLNTKGRDRMMLPPTSLQYRTRKSIAAISTSPDFILTAASALNNQRCKSGERYIQGKENVRILVAAVGLEPTTYGL